MPQSTSAPNTASTPSNCGRAAGANGPRHGRMACSVFALAASSKSLWRRKARKRKRLGAASRVPCAGKQIDLLRRAARFLVDPIIIELIERLVGPGDKAPPTQGLFESHQVGIVQLDRSHPDRCVDLSLDNLLIRNAPVHFCSEHSPGINTSTRSNCDRADGCGLSSPWPQPGIPEY